MDDKLKNALDFANYAYTLHNQKKLLKQKFFDDCVLYYDAGKFTITRDLISYCLNSQSKRENNGSVIILDDNDIPIQVKDIDIFTGKIIEVYNQSLEDYYNEYQKLQSNKSVKGLIDE